MNRELRREKGGATDVRPMPDRLEIANALLTAFHGPPGQPSSYEQYGKGYQLATEAMLQLFTGRTDDEKDTEIKWLTADRDSLAAELEETRHLLAAVPHYQPPEGVTLGTATTALRDGWHAICDASRASNALDAVLIHLGITLPTARSTALNGRFTAAELRTAADALEG